MKNHVIHPWPLGNHRLMAFFLLALILLVGLSVVAPSGVAQEPLEPPTKPDAERALPTFNERCANCHGPLGRGDGELTGNLAAPPRDYTDPQYLNEAVPSTMFQTIIQGRLDAGMPPFGPSSSNPLAANEIWDLVGVVYSLGTPAESVENGQMLYEQNCAACHGDDGTGNGPQAAELDTPLNDLTDLSYWTNRSNNLVASALQDNSIEDHTYQLNEDEIGDVVNFARTFSYDYYDPAAAMEPIEAATISGLVTNQTTGELLTEGQVNLRAFTPAFEEALSLTTTLEVDGTFSFDLEDISPELVYLASVEYENLTFNSDPARLESDNPEIEMPIIVFDKTTDPEVVSIEQIHLVLEFMDGRLVVNEIYVLNNNEPAVFVGQSGETSEGTIEIALPEAAEQVRFQRSFDSFGNFMAATEMIQTDRGWADTVPLRPGQPAMNLLVTYDLPYENGLDFSHPLFYDAARASVIMPDRGVRLDGPEWLDQGVQQMGDAGTFNSYGRPAIPAGDSLSFELEGRLETSAAAATTGNSGLAGDSTIGLLLGVGVLLLVIAGGVFTIRSWQTPAPVAASTSSQREDLLQAIADLDDQFESGKIEETEYEQERDTLMSELVSVWQE